ncbi:MULTISPECIES: DUF1289 domain-containing protein [Providencia]|uniref:DUF1289 domain-containing protein n=1 Tax=Providencia rettgeri TaxID=587 RepID=A0A3R8W0M5_PRORE|nr:MULTISPECIES: DUF1289 domain-containing protein [Providencia]ELR5072524.1 DUF1289 domain-containing protein [Providencia stuartii]ELR5069686.1 DUF1289 domain-containing protein [Providencia rettgeri]ELR5216319.1 DUF1289 domain-containing protein [Providencia rettgeri]ELR5221020.1 DUF1289 domain-containing protein [Providencia rettgeri]MBV2191171.1 DUF1289 domain-containing protein [Providencia rettgeri]
MAEQLEFFEIPSPCRGICQSNEQGYCRGCYRTRDERFNWLKFSDSEKRNVLRLCRQRHLRILNKKIAQENTIDTQQQLF